MARLFRWSMRHGAKILFALALIQLVAIAVPPLLAILVNTRAMAFDHSYFPSNDGIFIQIALLLQSLATVAIPLFAALLIDRLDRWLARGHAMEPTP